MTSEYTVGQLVARDYRKAKVFKSYGIDFCCGGGVSVEEACASYNVDVTEVLNALRQLDESNIVDNFDYYDWSLSTLVDYIVNEHHSYVLEALPMVNEFVDKVRRVHGENKPNVSEIANVFNELSLELVEHMEKEEKILFPFVKQLEVSLSGESIERPFFGKAENPISIMMQEHDSAGEAMKKIEALTNNYTPPKGACATHQVSYAYLKEFMDDLVKHVHLENNVLFPRVMTLEQKVFSN